MLIPVAVVRTSLIQVTGLVTAAGAIGAGTGFSVVKSGTGQYDITFTPSSPFAIVPNVLASAEGAGGYGIDIPSAQLTAAGFRVLTFTTTTAAQVDCQFNFLAVPFV